MFCTIFVTLHTKWGAFMDTMLKVASQFIRALTFVEVEEINRSCPDSSCLNLFLPTHQFSFPWSYREMLTLFPPDSVVSVTDRLLASYRFIGLKDSILIIGPFRSHSLRRYEASIRLAECHAESTLLEHYMKYFNSLPYVSDETIRIVTRNIMIALYGESHSVSERHIDMSTHHTESTFSISGAPKATVESIESRHSLEEFYMSQVAKGDFESAFMAYQKLSRDSTPAGNTMNIEGFAIIRTLTRLAARNGGVPAAGIHTITEAYRARFDNTNVDERQNLVNQFISDVCAIVRRYHTLSFSQPICQAVEYISRNLSEAITLESIAAETGISPTWLSKKFHQETGQTVIGYITRERMRTAADYLAFTNMSIQEVSAGVGIVDSNYFTKLFKQTYGIVPKEFRKNPQYVRLATEASEKK